jgi:hypothetical protein
MTESPDSNPNVVEFRTDSRRLKKSLLGVAALMIIGVFVAALVGGLGWRRAMPYAVVIPGFFCGVLWAWATLFAFHRVYTIGNDGVSVSKDGRTFERIAWADIARVSTGNLRVIAHDGRRVVFNLPPAIQRKAQEVISEWRNRPR